MATRKRTYETALGDDRTRVRRLHRPTPSACSSARSFFRTLTAFLTGCDQHASATAGTASPVGTSGSSPGADTAATTPGPARYSTSPSPTAGTTSDRWNTEFAKGRSGRPALPGVPDTGGKRRGGGEGGHARLHRHGAGRRRPAEGRPGRRLAHRDRDGASPRRRGQVRPPCARGRVCGASCRRWPAERRPAFTDSSTARARGSSRWHWSGNRPGRNDAMRRALAAGTRVMRQCRTVRDGYVERAVCRPFLLVAVHEVSRRGRWIEAIVSVAFGNRF